MFMSGMFMPAIESDVHRLVLAIISAAIGTEPDGWMCANTCRSELMISACAAIPMYGFRSVAGLPF